MANESKIKMVCPRCGSDDDVVRDAYASWSVQAQDWVLSSTHDAFACNACGADFKDPKEVWFEE